MSEEQLKVIALDNLAQVILRNIDQEFSPEKIVELSNEIKKIIEDFAWSTNGLDNLGVMDTFKVLMTLAKKKEFQAKLDIRLIITILAEVFTTKGLAVKNLDNQQGS